MRAKGKRMTTKPTNADDGGVIPNCGYMVDWQDMVNSVRGELWCINPKGHEGRHKFKIPSLGGDEFDDLEDEVFA